MSPAVVEKEKVHSSVKPGAQEKEWASACVGEGEGAGRL